MKVTKLLRSKKSTAVLFLGVAAIAIFFVWMVLRPGRPSDMELLRIAREINVDTPWERDLGWKKSSSSYPSGIEYGVMTLADGTIVKFAFRSHHLTDDIGATCFVAPGYERQLDGWFCCEVDFGSRKIANVSHLDRLIVEYDGESP